MKRTINKPITDLKNKVYFGDEIRNIQDCVIDSSTIVWNFTNLYGCTIGKNCMVGCFVEIQDNVTIGNNVRIQSHSFICSKVKISDNVFIGHGVIFINDLKPPSKKGYWKETIVEDGVIIGSNATILPVKIGKNSVIGAGAVVTKDIPPNVIVYGNPARIKKPNYNDIRLFA